MASYQTALLLSVYTVIVMESIWHNGIKIFGRL